MPNWCDVQLVVTGPEPELTAFQEAVQGVSGGERYADDLRQAIPEEIRPAKRTVPPLCFDRLDPEPLHVLGTQQFYGWRTSNWGVKWDVGSDATVTRDSTTLTLGFQTPWGPPDQWVDKAALLFPTLAFARHSYEAGNGHYETLIWEGGVEVFRADFSEAANREEFLLRTFGFSESEMFEDEEPEARDDAEVVEIRDEGNPLGVHTSWILGLKEAKHEKELKALIQRMLDAEIPDEAVNTLLAGHATVWPESVRSRLTEDHSALERLLTRGPIPRDLTQDLFEWACELLDRQPPERPRMPGDSIRESMGPELGDVVARMVEGRLPSGPEQVAYRAASFTRRLAGRVLSRLGEQQAVEGTCEGIERLIHRFRELPASEPESKAHRETIAAALIHFPDLSPKDIRIIAGEPGKELSQFDERLVDHPQSPHPIRVKRIMRGAQPGAVLRALKQKEVRAASSVRRSILKRERNHPALLVDLARDAKPSEFGEILRSLMAADGGAEHVSYALAAMEGATPAQAKALTGDFWAALLESEDRNVRERTLLILGKGKTRTR